MDRRLLSNAMNRLAAVLCDCCMAHLRCGWRGWRYQCRYLRTAGGVGVPRGRIHRPERRPPPVRGHRPRPLPAGAAGAGCWSGMLGPVPALTRRVPAAVVRLPGPAAGLVALLLVRLPGLRQRPLVRLLLAQTGRSWVP